MIPAIIEGKYTFHEISVKTELGISVIEEIVNYLSNKEIGAQSINSVSYSNGDKIRCAILAIALGADVDEICRRINWKDFELLVSTILIENHFSAEKNFRLKKPRIEIDVLSFKGIIGLAIDCKHWRHPIGQSSIEKIVYNQMKRTEILVRKSRPPNRGIQRVYPIITTLFEEELKIINGITIIPISKFRDGVSWVYDTAISDPGLLWSAEYKRE
jgi:hypothetical protein